MLSSDRSNWFTSIVNLWSEDAFDLARESDSCASASIFEMFSRMSRMTVASSGRDATPEVPVLYESSPAIAVSIAETVSPKISRISSRSSAFSCLVESLSIGRSLNVVSAD
jgi:hypothetical protein